MAKAAPARRSSRDGRESASWFTGPIDVSRLQALQVDDYGRSTQCCPADVLL